MKTRSSKGQSTLRVIRGGADDASRQADTLPAEPQPSAQTDPNATIRVSEPAGSGNSTLPEIGTLVSERYRLEKVIGEGGMGRVYLATDTEYEESFPEKAAIALKFLSDDFRSHPEAVTALMKEAKDSQETNSDHIVNVMHFEPNESNPYIIMEYMAGLPLDTYIQQKCPMGLSLEDALPLIEGMAAGLAHIHTRDLIHSDFKPNNVFVTLQGVAKVIDLGIARVWGANNRGAGMTRFDARELGAMTPEYASPEMFEDLDPDPRDDVYALGCVTYELLTGHHPFNMIWSINARARKLEPQRVPGISARQWRVLKQALAFDRERRIARPEEFIDRLTGRSLWRRWLVRGLSGAALTGALAAGGFALLAFEPPDPMDRFLDQLTTTNQAPLAGSEERRVTMWLDQGQDYIDIASDMYANDGLKGIAEGGHYLLSGAADNAYWAFREVLKRTDSAEAKEGIRAILATYTRWAEELGEQQQTEDALWTTCQGLDIFNLHERLVELRDTLTKQLDRSAGCAGLDAPLPPSFQEAGR